MDCSCPGSFAKRLGCIVLGDHRLSDERYKEQDGVYLRFSNQAELSDVAASRVGMAGVGPLLGAAFQATLQEGESLSVEIEIDVDEPALILCWGEGASLHKGIMDTRIRVYSVADDGIETQVGANDDWRGNDISSQAEVLILRDSQDTLLADKDAAVSVTLGTGVYRFELESLEGSDPLVLSLRSQVWLEKN